MVNVYVHQSGTINQGVQQNPRFGYYTSDAENLWMVPQDGNAVHLSQRLPTNYDKRACT